MINPQYPCFWSYATKWTIEYGDDVNKMKILETRESNALEDRGFYIEFPTKEFIFKIFRFSTIERSNHYYGLHYFDIIGSILNQSIKLQKVWKSILNPCCLFPLIDFK